MKVKFEDWFFQTGDEDKPVVQFDQGTGLMIELIEEWIRASYEAGFNACRDKWGGADYKTTIAEFGEKE